MKTHKIRITTKKGKLIVADIIADHDRINTLIQMYGKDQILHMLDDDQPTFHETKKGKTVIFHWDYGFTGYSYLEH